MRRRRLREDSQGQSDAEIDRPVYDLYGLTAEGIAIVERKD